MATPGWLATACGIAGLACASSQRPVVSSAAPAATVTVPDSSSAAPQVVDADAGAASEVPPARAHIRIVNAMAAPSAAEITAQSDDGSTVGVSYRTSGQLDVGEGTRTITVGALSVGVHAPGTTVVAMGTPSVLRVLEPVAASGSPTPTALRFVDALGSVAALDVCVQTQGAPLEPWMAAVPYEGVAVVMRALATAPARIELHVAAQPACNGSIVAAGDVDLGDVSSVILVATGDVGRPSVARALIVCREPAETACASVPLFEH